MFSASRLALVLIKVWKHRSLSKHLNSKVENCYVYVRIICILRHIGFVARLLLICCCGSAEGKRKSGEEKLRCDFGMQLCSYEGRWTVLNVSQGYCGRMEPSIQYKSWDLKPGGGVHHLSFGGSCSNMNCKRNEKEGKIQTLLRLSLYTLKHQGRKCFWKNCSGSGGWREIAWACVVATFLFQRGRRG